MIRSTRMICGNEQFASWAPKAITAAGPCASVDLGERIAAVAAAAHQNRLARDDAVVRAWLVRRADELCGADRAVRTGDLFDTGPSEGDWSSCEVPEQRMAEFAADPLRFRRTTPPGGRRAGALINQRDRAVPASGGADFGYADAGAVTLDLDDCMLVGSAMTETFLRDGLARWRTCRMVSKPDGMVCAHRCGLVERNASINMSRRSWHRPLATAGHCVSTRCPRERDRRTAAGCFRPPMVSGYAPGRSPATLISMGLTALAGRFAPAPPVSPSGCLLASGERAGLLTNGEIVRLLLCDPSRSDSHLSVG